MGKNIYGLPDIHGPMKIKLSYKIFGAFLMMSFMVVALMGLSYRYVVVSSFWDYINLNILNRLNSFSNALAAEYRTHQSWDRLKNDPDRWFELMAAALPKDDFGRWLPPSEKQQHSDMPVALKKHFQMDLASSDLQNPAEKPLFVSYRLAQDLALFDTQHHFLMGSESIQDAGRYSMRAIAVDGATVGWLGLIKREHMVDPYLMDYFKQQSMTLYSIGSAILLLAALVSLVLSKHLLKPIRQLSRGTRALTSFKFDTRIPIRTQDELGQLARDFNRMADTLKEYETMRQQWISDISHELRTPLAILKGEIEALLDGVRKVNPDTLDSFYSEVLRLSKLVADLHALSLADTQNLQARKKDVQPIEILKTMVNHFRGRMARNGIRLRLGFGNSGNPVISGDEDRLAQLFSNLLENTLRYTDSPGILKIVSRHDTQKMAIWFEDSAPGVPEQSLDRIFERLYRVETSRNSSLGGSGLGLAICKQIVASHGGIIRAGMAQAGGLRIHIVLPLKDSGWRSSKESA